MRIIHLVNIIPADALTMQKARTSVDMRIWRRLSSPRKFCATLGRMWLTLLFGKRCLSTLLNEHGSLLKLTMLTHVPFEIRHGGDNHGKYGGCLLWTINSCIFVVWAIIISDAAEPAPSESTFVSIAFNEVHMNGAYSRPKGSWATKVTFGSCRWLNWITVIWLALLHYLFCSTISMTAAKFISWKLLSFPSRSKWSSP